MMARRFLLRIMSNRDHFINSEYFGNGANLVSFTGNANNQTTYRTERDQNYEIRALSEKQANRREKGKIIGGKSSPKFVY